MSSRRGFHLASTFLVSIVLAGALAAQQAKPPDELPPEVDGNSEIGSRAAPDRRPGEGEGPLQAPDPAARRSSMAPAPRPRGRWTSSSRAIASRGQGVGFPGRRSTSKRGRQGRARRSTPPACT